MSKELMNSPRVFTSQASTMEGKQQAIGDTDQGQNESVTTARAEHMHWSSYGKYCSALNCGNARKKTPNTSFFNFPRDKDRSRVWVQNCRREDLLKKSHEQLKTSYCFCADHFEDSQFMNPNYKNKLIWNAVPTLFNVPNPPKRIEVKRPLPVKRGLLVTDIKTNNRKGMPRKLIRPTTAQQNGNLITTQQSASSSTASSANPVPNSLTNPNTLSIVPEPNKKAAATSTCRCADPVCALEKHTLSFRLANTNKKLTAIRMQQARLNQKMKRIQKQKENISLDKVLGALNDYLKDEVLEFVTAQLQIATKYKQIRWSDKIKNIMLSIYRSGPKAYKKLGQLFHLPKLKALRYYEKAMKELVGKEDAVVPSRNEATVFTIENDPHDMDFSKDVYLQTTTDADVESDGNYELLSTVTVEESVGSSSNNIEHRITSENASQMVNKNVCSSKHGNRDAEARLPSEPVIESDGEANSMVIDECDNTNSESRSMKENNVPVCGGQLVIQLVNSLDSVMFTQEHTGQ